MSKTNDKTIQSYDDHIQEYINGTPQKLDGALKAWIDESITGLSKSAKILEIGSGFGRDANYIESKGLDVQRTDIVPSFVTYLKEQGHQAKLLDAIKDDLTGTYDLIFADAVLVHFTRAETKHVVQKFHNALNKAGRFAFTLKQGEGESWSNNKLGAPRYFCYWDKEGIMKILEQNGFTNIKISDNNSSGHSNSGHNSAKWLHIIAYKD